MGHDHHHASAAPCCGCSSKKDKPLSAPGIALRHWIKLRLSALLLLPLTLWLIWSIVSLIGAEYEVFVMWLSAPVNASLMGLFIILGCYHGALGVQEIIEDYISAEKCAHCAIVAEKIAFGALAFICLASIGSVAF